MNRDDVTRLWRGALRRGRAAGDALRGREPVAVAPSASPRARPSGWWDLLPFTAHRIALAPGYETTVAGVAPVDDIRTQLVVDACGGSFEGRTVVDLGCLEGGFTLAFAQRGAACALGIEAREQSVQRCELARTLLGVDNAEFVVADIKDELARHDPFDVVFATGILYHVADPAGFLRTMRSACRHVALVDTHVARPGEATHDCSPMVTRELHGVTYRGRMFPEYPPDVTDDAKEAMAWAAYSDADAFWPVEDDLVRMMHEAGFARIDKIDVAGDGNLPRWGVDTLNRVMYLAYV
jgi:SAM-dependent methyltransferase